MCAWFKYVLHRDDFYWGFHRGCFFPSLHRFPAKERMAGYYNFLAEISKKGKREVLFQDQIVCTLCPDSATCPPWEGLGFSTSITSAEAVSGAGRASSSPHHADYSPHCAPKARASDGKGAFLSGLSGHWPFCELTFLSCSRIFDPTSHPQPPSLFRAVSRVILQGITFLKILAHHHGHSDMSKKIRG